MKLPPLAAIGLVLPLFVAGCGGGIQSDLELQNAKFSVNESQKAQFIGSVKNIGDRTYKSVFIVVDGYDGDQYSFRVTTSADLFMGRVLGPGETTSFSKDFEDGGMRANRMKW